MNFSEFSVKELQEKLRKGELKFEKKAQNSRRNISSDVWQKFSIVEVQHADGFKLVKNFVFCNNCKVFQSYNGATTSGLRNHKCILLNQPKISNGVTDKVSVKFSEGDKKLIRDGATAFVVDDLRPFYAVEGSGLNALIAAVLTIGKKYPNAHSDGVMALLPCRTTLRK